MKKRTKTLSAIITGVAILIGGIWMINESRYPNVPAFDDHFTREFLNKDKKWMMGFMSLSPRQGSIRCGFRRSIHY
ncbi:MULTISPECIES: hypothetical protein [Priestia]|uniref:hypothetical protein n=1 Tax=Priestia TaxID=2800373 RepID=UPI001CFB368E|nr:MULTISPECIES: hypothetical protein [Priestia]